MWFNSCWRNRLWCKPAGALLCLALAFAAPANAGEAGAAWRAELPGAVAVGSGELRWFGFRIYDAALWSGQQPFDPAARFALQLTYHRSISRERLAQTSLDEMRRLGTAPGDASLREQWETRLRNAFIDVEAGDQLIGVHLPGYGMRLYDRRKLVADIPDPKLARAFFDIWLNEASRDQALRRQLLGGRP
jgi:hypothetical protein